MLSRLSRENRSLAHTSTVVFAVVALVVASGAIITAAQANGKSSDAKSEARAANGTKVELSEYRLTPSSASVSRDGVLTVTNSGAIVHNLAIEGTDRKTRDLSSGQGDTINLEGLKDGEYAVYCAIPGHRSQGMVGTVSVGSSGTSGVSGHMSEVGESVAALLAQNEAMDERQKKPVAEYVAQVTPILEHYLATGEVALDRYKANTEGVGNQRLEPTILADGTKQFVLEAQLKDWEVAPGKVVRAWTYNGTVPGPALHVATGDRLRIVLKNSLPQSTDIHLHGLDTPMDADGVPFVTGSQHTYAKGCDETKLETCNEIPVPKDSPYGLTDPVKPGQLRTYTFTVRNGPSVGMYHSHHMAQEQVPDGMVGVLEVDDLPLPRGTDRIDARVPMVVNDAGVVGLSLNGKSFPATAPVITHVGKWTQIDYYNEGLQYHPMHLHGMPQLVIALDGHPLPEPHYEDTVSVAPGQRVSVLVRPTAEMLGPVFQGKTLPGIWAFHCHILSHAEGEDGMFGMVTTLMVLP